MVLMLILQIQFHLLNANYITYYYKQFYSHNYFIECINLKSEPIQI